MNDLRRELAPISTAAWAEIDAEARRVLTLHLAARRLVDFKGPLGWQASAVSLGRVDALARPADGVEAALRQVQPLVELRVPFQLARAELESVGRGAADPDLDPLVEAATRLARAEDGAVFNGYVAAGIRGMGEASSHRALALSDDYERYPGTVAEATRQLRVAGVDGPYAIALGPRCYAGLMQATGRSGYPVYEMVRRLLDGPVVWAPAVDGAIVLSMRGGDYELTVGQDLSVGYDGHTETSVRLFFLGSFTFRVLTPAAAVPLIYQS